MMYNMHFLQLILLLIFKSVNGNMECDCNTISAIQEVMQKEFFQIKLENSKMASRLRRLEASSTHSKTMNQQHSETVSDMSKDLDSSHDKTRNDFKRIETIESTLARIVPQFESYIQNKTDDIKHRMHEQRIDKIESELALVSNKADNILDMNDESENAMVQSHRTIKKAFQGEKIRRLNMELEMNTKIANIEGYCVNFTRTSEELIGEFKKETAIENKEFTAEINRKVLDMYNTINDHKINSESSLDALKRDLELEMNEKIKNIEGYCENFTRSSEELIDDFKEEVAIENKELAAEINQKVINIKNTINDNKIDVDSSFDDLKRDLELEMNEKIKNIEGYCENFTRSSKKIIDDFKKEVAIENKELAAEMNQKVINIKNAINDNKIHVDSSFDDLENEFSKTKKTLSNLEDIILKDRTDGRWSSWGSFGSCSDTCGRGVMIRSRTCTQPKLSLRGKHCEGSPVQIAVCNRNTCPEMRIFFTATGITGKYTAIFPKSIQNYGNGYDKSTGKFTCKYPGIYMFSFQISKAQPNSGIMFCKIYLNDVHIAGARGNPDGDVDDGFSISVSGTFHLNTNDEVYVSGCSGIDKAYKDYDSSFTGVLVVPDNI